MAIDVSKALRRSLTDLRTERARVDRQIAAIETALSALGSPTARAAGRGKGARKRQMSASARRVVSQRMKAYWAKRRAAAPAKGSKKGKA